MRVTPPTNIGTMPIADKVHRYVNANYYKTLLTALQAAADEVGYPRHRPRQAPPSLICSQAPCPLQRRNCKYDDKHHNTDRLRAGPVR